LLSIVHTRIVVLTSASAGLQDANPTIRP